MTNSALWTLANSLAHSNNITPAAQLVVDKFESFLSHFWEQCNEGLYLRDVQAVIKRVGMFYYPHQGQRCTDQACTGCR